MTDDRIAALARKAKLPKHMRDTQDALEALARFSALVAEDCAKAASEAIFSGNKFPVTCCEQMRMDCANAVRAAAELSRRG